MQAFNETRFQEQVDTALSHMRTVLEVNRNPKLPADVGHTYTDKYLLANFVTNSSLAAVLNNLTAIGLTNEQLTTLKAWSEKNTVTIVFNSSETCTFLKKIKKKIEPTTERVKEFSGVFGKLKRTDKVVTKITEYYWNFVAEYSIGFYRASDPEDKIIIQSQKRNCEIVNNSKYNPKPELHVLPLIEEEIGWFFQQLTDENYWDFEIDRKPKDCRTPRRNQDITRAFGFFQRLHSWSTRVRNYFQQMLFVNQATDQYDMAAINADALFVPNVGLFEERPDASTSVSVSSTSDPDTPKEAPVTVEEEPTVLSKRRYEALSDSFVLPLDLLHKTLAEQRNTIERKRKELDSNFPIVENTLITAQEATLVVLLAHCEAISQVFTDGIDYIEHMLYQQLVAALGKVIGAEDFRKYMLHHYRKLFRDEFQPEKFCCAIRRPLHYPEGIVSIEGAFGGSSVPNEPVSMLVSHSLASQPTTFPLSAGTSVSFLGERYVHAYISQQFSVGPDAKTNLSLIARARQFSCFILVIGRIVSGTQLEPKHAIIVQNKDEVLIPLLFEQIPSAKTFRDAIESLSPEQQEFARAFRSMQLESTLFGVCIIQIKPQLEKLLHLPATSLTKELQLTQHLLQLFTEFHIPSDLVKYAGDPDAHVTDKLDAVKKQVKEMFAMIDAEKRQQLHNVSTEFAYANTVDTIIPHIEVVQDCITTSSPRKNKTRAMVKRKAHGGALFGRKLSSSRGDATSSTVPLRRSSSKSTKVATAPQSPSSNSLMASPSPKTSPVEVQQQQQQQQQPQPQPQQQQQQQQQQEQSAEREVESSSTLDFTNIPVQLDRQLELLDVDHSVRPIIIHTGEVWSKTSQPGLLAAPVKTSVNVEEQRKERNQAFDLLDALTRSGLLVIHDASLHVLLAVAHCFDQSLFDTLIKQNTNPIDKVERTSLIVASAIHQQPVENLLKPEHLDRVRDSSPHLFG